MLCYCRVCFSRFADCRVTNLPTARTKCGTASVLTAASLLYTLCRLSGDKLTHSKNQVRHSVRANGGITELSQTKCKKETAAMRQSLELIIQFSALIRFTN